MNDWDSRQDRTSFKDFLKKYSSVHSSYFVMMRFSIDCWRGIRSHGKKLRVFKAFNGIRDKILYL